MSSLFSAGLMLAFIFHTAIGATPLDSARPKALVLKPLRGIRRGSERRDVDRRALLDLRTEETFHWSDENGLVMAQFRVVAPGTTENIVNLERMIDDGAIQGIECPPAGSGRGSLNITFTESPDLQHALNVWQWVDQKPQHRFTAVLGPEDCASPPNPVAEEGARTIYDVSSLSYPGNGNTVMLDAQQTTWKDVIHTFDLTIGKPTLGSSPSDLQGRDLFGDIVDTVGDGIDMLTSAAAPIVASATKAAGAVASAVADALPPIDPTINFVVPLDAQLSGKNTSFSNITLTCLNCSITGAFAFTARFRVDKGDFQEASLQLKTSSPFKAHAQINIQTDRNLTVPAISTSIPIFQRDFQTVILPGILELGPRYEIGLGVEVDALVGDLEITAGGTATVPADSVVKIDMLSQSDDGAFDLTGWTVDFASDDATYAGFRGAKVTTSLRPAVAMVMNLLGLGGVEAEVFAKTPFVTGTFKEIRSDDCSACGGFEEGMQGDFGLGAFFGARIRAKVGKGLASAPIPIRKFTFFEKEVPVGTYERTANGAQDKGDIESYSINLDPPKATLPLEILLLVAIYSDQL
ncbi:hypothetical protein QBC34DRAFT_469971 [Podospora aff. communis PSN243]|uniref:Uncharacterized protein n=1 Tax=Podospora aff. communis PSN243 TaxID=3040156 RepID=A0AAV9GG45_9PEZI|nr:hypothetical protein QBC34DRAFT_469971 [Podospora aff. communis PSN243]